MARGPRILKYIEREELPAFFRELADAIESGGTDEYVCMDDIAKFKIGGKAEFGKVKLKAKFKTSDECVDETIRAEAGVDGIGKPRYADLKKRMRTSFKMLLKMIHDGQMPPAGAVESFLGDSALMVTYSGYGDEFYDRYTEVCEQFRTAYEAGDMDAMHTAIDALIHEKSRCHAKYD